MCLTRLERLHRKPYLTGSNRHAKRWQVIAEGFFYSATFIYRLIPYQIIKIWYEVTMDRDAKKKGFKFQLTIQAWFDRLSSEFGLMEDKHTNLIC